MADEVDLLPADMRIACIPQKDADSLKNEVEAVTCGASEAPSEHRIRCLLSSGSQSWDHLWYFVNTLGETLKGVSDWSTAVKGLLLLHQLLRCGSRAVETDLLEMLDSSSTGHSILNLQLIADSFRAGPGLTSKNQTAFVRAYALFVFERMKCAKVISLVGWARRTKLNGTEACQVGSLGNAYWKEQRSETLLKQVHSLQELLEKLVHCQPTSQQWSSSVMLVNALEFILRDSFDLYGSVNYALMELVERFGGMNREQAFDCLRIHRRAADQAEGLALLYHRFGELGVGQGVTFPTITVMGESYLQILENYLMENSSYRQSENQPLAITDVKLMEPVKVSCVPQVTDVAKLAAISAAASQQFDDTWRILFATDKYSTPSQPQQNSQAFRGMHAHGNNQQRLAWERSPCIGESRQSGKGWEGASVSQPTSPVPHLAQPVMPRGFDQLLLDSLYQTAQAQRREYTGVVGGGATPSRTIHQFGADPFIASVNIPPPPYVQMALRAQQQMGMVLQQKMMAQHAYYSSVLRGETPLNHQQLSNPSYNCRNVDNVGVQYGSVLVPYS